MRPSEEQVARVLAPEDWRLHDDPRYDHLPQQARDSLTRRSLNQARAVLALFAESETVTTARERIRAALESWDGDALVTVRQADSLVDHLTAALVEPETVTTAAETVTHERRTTMTDNEYTPTAEEVRLDYVVAYTNAESSQVLAGLAFDRWYAAEKAKWQAEALRDAADDAYRLPADSGKLRAALRDRADRIEMGWVG